MTGVLLAGFCALQLSFIWARFKIFRIDGPAPPGVRLIEASTLLCIVAGMVLIAGRGSDGLLLGAAAVLTGAASAALFAWAVRSVRPRQLTAAFSPDAPVELLRSGAFGLVRNPFYLAYLLAHALPLLASRSLWGLVPLVWMALLYHRAAVLEERKFQAGPLAADYRRYAQATGRFLPRLSLGRKPSGESA